MFLHPCGKEKSSRERPCRCNLGLRLNFSVWSHSDPGRSVLCSLVGCLRLRLPLSNDFDWFSFLQMVIYTPLVYFLTGLTLANNGAHYITYAIAAFLCANTFAMFTRFAASLCHTKESASGISGLCITFFLLFSGFLIAKNKVPDWWIWVYYISPLQWAITALICNEFLSDTYSQPCNNSITYCRGRSDMNIGQAYLAIYDFPTTTLRGYWVPVLVLFFYYWVLSCCCFWTVANVRHEEVKLPSIARLLRNQTAISKPLEGKTKFRFSRIFKSVQNANNDVGIKFEPAMLSFHQIVYEVLPFAELLILLIYYVSFSFFEAFLTWI